MSIKQGELKQEQVGMMKKNQTEIPHRKNATEIKNLNRGIKQWSRHS